MNLLKRFLTRFVYTTEEPKDGDFKYKCALILRRCIFTIHSIYCSHPELEKKILNIIMSLRKFKDWVSFGCNEIEQTIDSCPIVEDPSGQTPPLEQTNRKAKEAAKEIVDVLF